MAAFHFPANGSVSVTCGFATRGYHQQKKCPAYRARDDSAKEFVWFATSIHARDSITDNIVQLFHALEKNDLFDCIMEAPLFDTSTLRFLLELIDDLLSDFTQSPQYANVSSKDIQTYFNLLIQIRYHVATFLF